MFYPLGKNSEKPFGGWHSLPPFPPPPTLYVQGLKNKKILKTDDEEKNCLQGTTR